jgi:hypothetical protein
MKPLIFLVVLSMAVAGRGLLTPASGQSPPEWFIVFEEKPSFANDAQFMKAQMEAADLWKKHNPLLPLFAFQNSDNSLYRIVPIRSFASIDTLYGKMEQMADIMHAASSGKEETSLNTSTVSGTVMMWMPELSHYLSPEFTRYHNKPYAEWLYAYLHPGHEQEAAEALKKFRDYYINNGLDYPWDAFRVLLGNDTPLLIGLFRAESPSALRTKGNGIWEKHGSELRNLWDDLVRHAWKIETKTGWFKPSLSNIPVVSPEEPVAGGM